MALTVPIPLRRASSLSCPTVPGLTRAWDLVLCSLEGLPSLCYLPGAPHIWLDLPGWLAAMARSPLPTLLSQMLLIPPCPPVLNSHTPQALPCLMHLEPVLVCGGHGLSYLGSGGLLLSPPASSPLLFHNCIWSSPSLSPDLSPCSAQAVTSPFPVAFCSPSVSPDQLSAGPSTEGC